ncbi:MAG: hypothetical protein ACUVRK_08780 [Spirochaetota bacterium]
MKERISEFLQVQHHVITVGKQMLEKISSIAQILADNGTEMNELTIQIKAISHRLSDVIGIESA